MIFDVKKFATLVAIAEEKSFTAAAERLHTSQPWVSEQLKLLEEALGLALVQRVKGKYVRLTPQGEELYAIAKRVVLTCEEARHEVEALRNRNRDRLVLGVDSVTLYMPERDRLMADYMARMPGVELEVVNEQPSELFAGLSEGRFDLLLTLFPHPDKGVETFQLYEYELKFFVPKTVVRQFPASNVSGPVGAKVLTLPDSYHPAFFSWLKSAMEPARLQWASCPEVSFHALVRYALIMGLPVLSPDFSSRIPELGNEMEARVVRMPQPVTAKWGLMREPGYRKRSAEVFWDLAARSVEARAPAALGA
jgi:DNA-binding transcriptional LysR family regulator